MPNGVICGGAADGANQAGEIVTCHAMTTRPDGATASAGDTVAAKIRIAAESAPITPRRGRKPWNDVMRPSLVAQLSVLRNAIGMRGPTPYRLGQKTHYSISSAGSENDCTTF